MFTIFVASKLFGQVFTLLIGSFLNKLIPSTRPKNSVH